MKLCSADLNLPRTPFLKKTIFTHHTPSAAWFTPACFWYSPDGPSSPQSHLGVTTGPAAVSPLAKVNGPDYTVQNSIKQKLLLEKDPQTHPKSGECHRRERSPHSSPLKLVFIQLQMENRCSQESKSPCQMRKYNVTKLHKHYFSG